jgi:hypothetical protein
MLFGVNGLKKHTKYLISSTKLLLKGDNKNAIDYTKIAIKF